MGEITLNWAGPFSVPITEGSTAREALRRSLDLAQHAEGGASTASGWPSNTACGIASAATR